MGDQWRMLKFFVLFSMMIVLTGIIACGGSASEPKTVEKQVIVEKEVNKEVPVEKIVEGEVNKEVPVEIEKIVIATPVAVATGKFAPLPAGAKYGGQLVRNTRPGQPRDLDFMSCGPGSCINQAAPVHNTLIRINPENTNELIGDLAINWEPGADGLSFIFQLRKGIKWHDGSPFTAADVKATFDRALDPDFNSTRVASHAKKLIKQVDLIDDNTVRFVQNGPGLLLIPTLGSAWFMIAQKNVLDEGALGEKSMGTGAFKFVKWERDVEFLYERNPDYFEDGLPFLDSMRMIQIGDRVTLTGAILSDQLGMWVYSPYARPSEIELIVGQLGEDKVNLIPFPGTNQVLAMNTKRKPFDDIRVRRAVFLALDRQDFLDKVFRGQGLAGAVLDPGHYGDVALPLEEVNKMPGVRQPKDQDIAEAKRLLADAGFPDGFTLEDNECLGQTAGTFKDYIQVPIAQLRKALNIDCKILLQDRASVFARIADHDFTLYGGGGGVQFGDPDATFSLFYTPGAGRNWGEWEDPEFTKLYNEQLTSTDAARRRELHIQMQHFIYGGSTSTVSMSWDSRINLTRSYVKGWHPLGPWFEHARMDRVWIDKGG